MIGFIGGGNMADAIIKGLTINSIKNIFVSEPLQDRREYLENTYKIRTTADNKTLALSSDIIIVAVKPQDMEKVLRELVELNLSDKILISIAAGITLSYISSIVKIRNIVRVMPNTPSLVLEGMSVICLSEGFDNELTTIEQIFSSIGKFIYLSEKYMDTVTAVSGSGPAFVALFIAAMIKSAEKLGLSNSIAKTLVYQTLSGTVKLIANTNIEPQELVKKVASPGGTTEAGIKVLNDNSFDSIIYETILRAKQRSKELGAQTK
ncbi:pyrroline-5-carboxylate reductase [Candidatus Magnetoovum chiemensis]|nr:pyrroline-5-carboxylate reductase [Candidatus Magnetoovum chiemensis]